MDEVFGREAERSALTGFLASSDSPVRILVFEGPSGIGRTLLWRSGIASARAAGWTVFASSPSEDDAEVDDVVIADLAGRVVTEGLPGPQQEALDSALRRRPVASGGMDVQALAMAMGRILEPADGGAGTLVGVDDAQWVDQRSGRILGMVIRRTETVRWLLTVRTDRSPSPGYLAMARAMPPERIRRLVLDPLSMEDLDRVVRSRTGHLLLRPAIRELADRARGNPGQALRLLTTGGVDTSIALGATPSITAAERYGRSPFVVRSVLRSAAMLSRPLVRWLAELHPGIERSLRAVVLLGLGEVDGALLRPTDPHLLPSLVSSMSVDELRHARIELATRLSDPEEQAWQRGLAAENADPALAAHLAGLACDRARAGYPERAAELASLAAAVTRADDRARSGMRLLAGWSWLRAGDTGAGRAMLDLSLRDAGPGADRARVLHALALADMREHGWRESIGTLRAALAESTGEARLRLAILIDLARHLAQTVEQPLARSVVDSAVELATSLDDEDARGRAEAARAYIDFLTGSRPHPLVSLERIPASWLGEPPDGEPECWDASAYFDLAMVRKWSDRTEEARSMLASIDARAHGRHEEAVRAGLVFQLGEMDIWAGRLSTAAWRAEEANALGRQHGAPVLTSLYLLALVALHGGSEARARELIDSGLVASQGTGNHRQQVRFTSLAGQLDLALGNLEAASVFLLRATDLAELAAYGEPAVVRFDGDTIEVLALLGRREEAQSLLERLEERATLLSTPWTRAMVLRCRGILGAGRGWGPDVAGSFEESRRVQQDLGLRYEEARTLLAHGRMARRARQRRVARTTLGEARSLFASMGMRLWSDAAAAEEGRIGGRTPEGQRLTEAETLVARLAAEGLPTQEIARRTGTTVKTVGSHLEHIYDKLDVHSRAQLARVLANGTFPDVTWEPGMPRSN